MIYSIVGTNKDIREKAHKELSALGTVTQHVYTEHAETLKLHVDAVDIFGDLIIIVCISLGESASSKEVLVSLLPDLEASKNIFIIDEPFADVHLGNKLSKVSKKFFNAKEEKVKDTSVFALCDSFARRDKKQAWIDYMAIRDTAEGEAIQGALWWKFQTLWQGVSDGKRAAYTEEECKRIGGELLRSTILAHQGELDLKVELERIILSI